MVARKQNQTFSKAKDRGRAGRAVCVPAKGKETKKKTTKKKKEKTRASTRSDLIPIYVSSAGRAIEISPRTTLFTVRRMSLEVSVLSRGALIPLARSRPTDKFTGSYGGIMRRRRSPTMAKPPRRFPVLAHNPRALFSRDSAEACMPVRLLRAPRYTGRLKLLARGRSIYFVINSAAVAPRVLLQPTPTWASGASIALYTDERASAPVQAIVSPVNFSCLLLKGQPSGLSIAVLL